MFRTDPDEVRSDQRGAAGTPCLAVDVDAGPLPPVLQGELHPLMEVLQGGDSGQVHGAQPQLLHACISPLLLPNIRSLHSAPHVWNIFNLKYRSQFSGWSRAFIFKAQKWF